jgi:hypothetical protein
MRTLLVVAAIAAALFAASPAAATTGPAAAVTVRCEGGKVVATFNYTGFNPANHLTAVQTLHIGAREMQNVVEFDGPAATSVMQPTVTLGRRTVVHAMTEVFGGAGRLKASGEAEVVCRRPPPPQPPPDPPPPRKATSAKLIGPCGDPMYKAVFNNKRSTVAVTFRWRYHSFDTGSFVTLRKRVAAGERYVTGYKHVSGRTPTTIRAHGELLLSKLTAPGGNYRPCR